MQNFDAVPIPRMAKNTATLPILVGENATERSILLTSLELFALHGYGSTSIRDISKKAGLQPTTLYYHFPSKHAVLARLLKIGFDEHYRVVNEAYETAEKDAISQLKAVVSAHVASHCAHPVLGLICITECHHINAETADKVIEILGDTEVILMTIFEHGIAEKTFSVSDPYLALRAIGAMGSKLVHWYGPNCGRSAEEIQKAYVEFALKIVL